MSRLRTCACLAALLWILLAGCRREETEAPPEAQAPAEATPTPPTG